jgi:hypothetical protein
MTTPKARRIIDATPLDTILQVVRGERPWTDLRAIGIDIDVWLESTGYRSHFENPQQHEATANVHDLAQGFITHRHDPCALREWAFVMETVDVDLDAEQHPAGDRMLEALWDASFGNPIGAEVWQTIEELARTDEDGT